MDNEPILKKTLVTVGTMVGAWIAFVGTVSLVAVLVTSHVVGSSGGAGDTGGSVTTNPAAPGARPTPRPDPARPTSAARPQVHESI